AGTSKKLESPACNSPASGPSQPGSKSSSRAGTRTAPVPSETLRKRMRSPDATKVKFALPRGSPAPALHHALSPSKKQPSLLSGTAGTTTSKQKCVPAKCKLVSAAKTKANSAAPRAARVPVTNLCTVAKFAHSQQLLAKPPENDVQISGAGSQHPQKAPQTTSHLARNLKTASELKLSASYFNLAVSKHQSQKASKSPPPLLPTSKNVSSAGSKQPNASNRPQVGPSLSKPAERTPLSVVRLPQTSAKAAVTKKPAQPSTKGQHSTKNLQTNKSLAPAAKKALPKEQAYKKGTPGVSEVPLLKGRQDDHYFVMTGTKKPRK
ncbi:GA2L3 protein, partial [Irena cyanogastra]|nr:GA2L3 protein [Irena cyanogastra]